MKRFLKIAFSFTIVTLELVTTVLYIDKRTTGIQKYAFYPAFVDYYGVCSATRHFLFWKFVAPGQPFDLACYRIPFVALGA